MRARFFYGYVILALCFVNLLCVRGAVASFSVFYIALLEEFGWSHATGASIVSINSLVYALASPLVGWTFDAFGPRYLIPLGGLAFGTGLFLSGLSHSLWELYICYGILAALGHGALGFVSHSALISHWFLKRRATAIGLANMGQGVGTLIIVPLTQVLITGVGWRSAFMLLGGLVLIVIVIPNAVLLRRDPKDIGEFADGDPLDPGERPQSHGVRASARAWTVRSVLRSYPFWILTAGHFCLGAGIYVIYTHLVAYLAHKGFETLAGAFVLGLIGFMRIGGTLFWGMVSDRLGRIKTYWISILITLAGVACFLAVSPRSPLWIIYAIGILYGIGHSAGTPTYGAVIADLFSGPQVGTIYGLVEVSFGLGMALGAWLGGAIYDLSGSYYWAFVFVLFSFAISYVTVRESFAWHELHARVS
ncbi:MAG: MFS transporter [Deltaproteobacteria bacterium]|nr:MFS transporter [Deltaproteobacteria bacterium]